MAIPTETAPNPRNASVAATTAPVKAVPSTNTGGLSFFKTPNPILGRATTRSISFAGRFSTLGTDPYKQEMSGDHPSEAQEEAEDAGVKARGWEAIFAGLGREGACSLPSTVGVAAHSDISPSSSLNGLGLPSCVHRHSLPLARRLTRPPAHMHTTAEERGSKHVGAV